MGMNKGVGITRRSGWVLEGGEQTGENWDNCNSIINKRKKLLFEYYSAIKKNKLLKRANWDKSPGNYAECKKLIIKDYILVDFSI